MEYPKDFIAEVKELYPDYPEIHRLVETHSLWLGEYLYGSWGLGLDTILTATSLEELQKIARIEKRKIELYNKWLKVSV